MGISLGQTSTQEDRGLPQERVEPRPNAAKKNATANKTKRRGDSRLPLGEAASLRTRVRGHRV